jgi:hypothetical protein
MNNSLCYDQNEGTQMLNDPVEQKWSDSARFEVSQQTLSKSFNKDQLALVHIKTRRIHILNPTAVEVWKLLQAGSTRGEICRLIQEQFQADEKEISTEIDRILILLECEGLISIQK